MHELASGDTLDERLVNDVRNCTGRIIDVQGGYPHGTPFVETINAWPALEAGTPPADSDEDGMPDEWEIANGLDPNRAADRAGIAANGYTHLENYLNAQAVVPVREALAPADKIRLFPNPAGSQLVVEHPRAHGPAPVVLYRLDGVRVMHKTCAPHSERTALYVDMLSPGTYLAVFLDDRGATGRLFIRQ